MSYPVPFNEPERLTELERLRSAEWGFSAALDRLCSLATRQLKVPIALVSLVGDKEQNFAGRQGVDMLKTSRDVSFCAHAIMTPQPFVVENATEDSRFCENVFVTGDPGIRAYAGVPLATRADLRIGAFCAIDVKPRRFTADELALLGELGGIATAIIEFEHMKLQLDDALEEAGEMQEDLREHALALESSNKELAEFAQTLSHDLKAPIRTIRTYLPDILENARTGELATALEDYRLVLKSATHMDQLVDTLREYCKVRYEKAPVTDLPMNVVVEDAVGILKPAIEERAAVISWGELPTVKGNGPQLILLMQNLIGNALKFSAEPPRISITAASRGADAVFCVKDNGIGIKADYLEQIFEPFQRLHAASRYAGAGLGLAICRKIVERHQGRIWCESAVGQGSMFHFTLPAAQ